MGVKEPLQDLPSSTMLRVRFLNSEGRAIATGGEKPVAKELFPDKSKMNGSSDDQIRDVTGAFQFDANAAREK